MFLAKKAEILKKYEVNKKKMRKQSLNKMFLDCFGNFLKILSNNFFF